MIVDNNVNDDDDDGDDVHVDVDDDDDDDDEYNEAFTAQGSNAVQKIRRMKEWGHYEGDDYDDDYDDDDDDYDHDEQMKAIKV